MNLIPVNVIVETALPADSTCLLDGIPTACHGVKYPEQFWHRFTEFAASQSSSIDLL